jgi:MFS family permease
MARGVLREGPFRLLFAGRAISSLGDRLVPVALAFAVLDLTGSVTDLGLVIAAQTTPLILLVLFGGVWADRLPRQRVMLASDCVRAVAQATSAALLLTGNAHIWQLMVLQALYGGAEAFFGPASTAVVAQTVGEEELQPANAMLGLADNAASIAGPALAGVIVATASPGWGLAFDAATFLASGAFLLALRIAPAEIEPRRSTLTELREGWRAFSSRRWMWASVLFFTLYISLVYDPWQVLGPAVAREHLGGAAAWAAISASLGAGAVVGGLLGLRWRPRLPLRVAFLMFVVTGPALLALLGAHAPLAAIIPMAILDGAAASLFNAWWFTAQQTEVPAAELSRVSSWDYLGSLAFEPAGLVVVGPVAAVIGVSATLYGAAGIGVLLAVAVLLVPEVRNFSPRESRGGLTRVGA